MRTQSKMTASNVLDQISYWTYILSWVAIVLYIVARFATFGGDMEFAAMMSILSLLSISLVCSFIRNIVVKSYRVFNVCLLIITIALGGYGSMGLFWDIPDLQTLGLFGLIAVSFVPAIANSIRRWRSRRTEPVVYEYDKNGNVIADEERDAKFEQSEYILHSTSSSGSYSVVNEVFGIPQPKDPPPVVISADEMFDGENEPLETNNAERAAKKRAREIATNAMKIQEMEDDSTREND